MRYIRTSNNYVEFIEADNNGEVLSTRGFQFGELYFRIENNKVTFYLNDQENPWRNDVWTINIPFELDGEIYDNENDASIALHNIMNDRFQEQLDELRADLEEEIGRSIATDEALGEEIDDERDRAINAEIYLQNQVTELSGTVATFDGRITRVEEIVSGVQEDLHDEIVRSTNKDTEHDVLISGLTEDVEYLEIHKQNVLTAGKYITIQNDIISADSNHVYRITQNAYDNLPEIDPEGLYIITDAPDISLCDYTPLSAFTAEVNRSTMKDLEHDLLISGNTDAIEAERASRIASDELLQTNLNNEINRAMSAETELYNEIINERNLRMSGDTILHNEIISERDRAISAETILHDEIINERDRALESESAITLALHNEVVRSTEKDALHDTLISGLTDGLQNEINRATAAENSLRNDLNIEISARSSADSAITLALSNEITRSTEKDAELSALISGLTDSYSAETLSRIAADNLLQQNLNNEIARATSAETILHNEIISGSTYTAGDGIDITNKVISTITKFWTGSQSQWAEISGSTDVNTIYLIY